MKKELTERFKRRGKCDCLNLKPPRFKVEKSSATPAAYIVAFAVVNAVLVLFMYPVWREIWLVYTNVGLSLANLLFWIRAVCSNPGYIKRPKDMDFLKLMQMVEPMTLCPDCFTIKTPRSQHCSICNQCVERFDHHCPWINNCVGIGNHCSFIMYLIVLVANVGFILVSTTLALIKVIQDEKVNIHHFHYKILPEFVIVEKVLYYSASGTVLIITGILFPVTVVLLYT